MAEQVTRGFLAGHWPTLGFYAGSPAIRERVSSVFETELGLTPLVRVRFDLDGDGVYEIIEDEKVLSVAGLNRSSGLIFGSITAGTLNLSLCNNDGRWSDFLPGSFLYSSAYIGKPVSVEINFDWIHKGDEDYWSPLFRGYIEKKTENANDRSVSFIILDEWKNILQKKLTYPIVADEYISYESDTDNRLWNLGLYFGKKKAFAELDRKSEHLLVPCAINFAGPAYRNTVDLTPRYQLWKPCAVNLQQIKTGLGTPAETKRLWFWLWNDGDSTVAGSGGWSGWASPEKRKQQWAYIKNFDIANDGQYYYYEHDGTAPAGGLRFYDMDGVPVLDIDLAYEYFEKGIYAGTEAYDKFDASVSCGPDASRLLTDATYWDNPVHILYYVLKDLVGIDPDLFDKETIGTSWKPGQYYPRETNYYSWDNAAYMAALMNLERLNIHITEELTVENFISEITKMMLGQFFMGYGYRTGEHTIEKTLKLTLLQYWVGGDFTYLTLTGERISDPSLSVVSDQIYNVARANYHRLLEDDPMMDPNQFVTEEKTSPTSIAQYGERVLDMTRGPKDLMFYTELMGIDADFLIDIFSQPQHYLELTTDLKGLLFDLRDAIGIHEPNHLYLDPDDALHSGLMQVLTSTFDTRNFQIKLIARVMGEMFVELP